MVQRVRIAVDTDGPGQTKHVIRKCDRYAY